MTTPENLKEAFAGESQAHQAAQGKDLGEVQFYLCPVCGNIEFGAPPANCPICGAEAERFTHVS